MSEKTLWILLTIIGTIGALGLGLFLKKLNGFIRAACEGFQSPQLSFRYRADDVHALLGKLEGAGMQKQFDRFCLLMAAMMAEVLLVLMVVTHNITDIHWLQMMMFPLSGVIWLMGTLETLVLKKQPALASVLSLIKWGAFAVWTLGMFAGLFIRSTAI